MVRSDLGISGVAFSLDTESGFKDAVVINAAYGLEMIVQGAVSPDEYIVFKPLLKMVSMLLSKTRPKDKMMVWKVIDALKNAQRP
jgi:pyruvate,water dikinase